MRRKENRPRPSLIKILFILNSDHNSIVSTNQMNVPRGDTYITGHITRVRHGNLVNTGYSNHNATSCLSFLTLFSIFAHFRLFPQSFLRSRKITNLKFSNNSIFEETTLLLQTTIPIYKTCTTTIKLWIPLPTISA